LRRLGQSHDLLLAMAGTGREPGTGFSLSPRLAPRG